MYTHGVWWIGTSQRRKYLGGCWRNDNGWRNGNTLIVVFWWLWRRWFGVYCPCIPTTQWIHFISIMICIGCIKRKGSIRWEGKKWGGWGELRKNRGRVIKVQGIGHRREKRCIERRWQLVQVRTDICYGLKLIELLIHTLWILMFLLVGLSTSDKSRINDSHSSLDAFSIWVILLISIWRFFAVME